MRGYMHPPIAGLKPMTAGLVGQCLISRAIWALATCNSKFGGMCLNLDI